jgi:hypothetical protein
MAIRRFSTAEPGVKSNKFWDQDTAQGAMEPIGFQKLLTNTTGQVFFFNIPQHYQDLMIVVNARQATSTGGSVYARLNATGANRSYAWLEGSGSSVSSAGVGTSGDGYAQFGNIASSNAGTGVYGSAIGHIFNYANSSYMKTILGRSADDSNGSGRVRLEAALYEGTSAVTSLEIVTDGITGFSAGSTFALYGIRG